TQGLSSTNEDVLLPHVIFLTERNMQSELCPLLPVDLLAELGQEVCATPYPEPASDSDLEEAVPVQTLSE
ncbi:MAG: hypothetical protein SV422_00565, partial [Pseudomonadota bacterium]|nr:hypothetical protein [Pseudomonadota bacterium]